MIFVAEWYFQVFVYMGRNWRDEVVLYPLIRPKFRSVLGSFDSPIVPIRDSVQIDIGGRMDLRDLWIQNGAGVVADN